MRAFKIFFYRNVVVVYLFGCDAFLDESKNFVIEKEINYPIDRVFPQFNNFQHFTEWHHYFSQDKNYNYRYFLPYEGQGSSMYFENAKQKVNLAKFSFGM